MPWIPRRPSQMAFGPLEYGDTYPVLDDPLRPPPPWPPPPTPPPPPEFLADTELEPDQVRDVRGYVPAPTPREPAYPYIYDPNTGMYSNNLVYWPDLPPEPDPNRPGYYRPQSPTRPPERNPGPTRR